MLIATRSRNPYEARRRYAPWDPRSACTRRSCSCRRTSTSARRRRHGPLGDGPRGRLGGDHRVHDPVLLRLLGRHEEIAIGVPLDLLHAPTPRSSTFRSESVWYRSLSTPTAFASPFSMSQW